MATRIHKPHLIRVADTARCLNSIHAQHRCFSATPISQLTRRHRALMAWLKGPGSNFKRPRPGSTNYLSAYDKRGNLIRAMDSAKGASADAGNEGSAEKGEDDENSEGHRPQKQKSKDEIPPETQQDLRPFPLNPHFTSEPVLSKAMRDEIYRRIVVENKSVREVSIAMKVTMERIGAVVRLQTIEQEWQRQGIPLNNTYQRTVLDMLPQTKWNNDGLPNGKHESINDLPVHAATLPQFFHPTSESRHFTRVDASRVFHRYLLPPDARIPHPEMIDAAKDMNDGYRRSEIQHRQRQRIEDIEEKSRKEKRAAAEREARRTTIFEGKRWDFRFKDVSVEASGKNGRGRAGVGWRYGAPHDDRKKGKVKIPTRVD